MTEHNDDLSQLHESLEALGKRHDEWRKDRDDKHRRGLNDLNVFTTLLGAGDEVRLHSRFIAFLLDPNGDHGQGDLFLRLFMEECGHPDFKIKTAESQVRCEYQNIDIYITDGSSHVIIENKIWAKDQWEQIERYIDIISSEGGDIDRNQEVVNSAQEATDESHLGDDENENNDILVIYLSLDKPTPTKDSLGGWEVEENYLVRGDQRCMYKNLHYRPFKDGKHGEGIWSWLSKSHKQIHNITNLSVIITQYREVIDKLYNRYEGNTMNFIDSMANNHPDDFKRLVKFAGILNQNRNRLYQKLATGFWENVVKRLEEKLQGSGWCLVWDRDEDGHGKYTGMQHLVNGTKWQAPLRVVPCDNRESVGQCPCVFAFDYDANNYGDVLIGAIWTSEGKSFKGEMFLDKVENEKNPPLAKLKSSEAWPKYIIKYPSLMTAIIEREDNFQTFEKTTTDFVGGFMVFFETYEKKIREFNDNPKSITAT